MPHSIKASGDSNSIYSLEPMGLDSAPVARSGIALSSNKISSQANRRGPPAVEEYSELIGKADSGDLEPKILGAGNSMPADYNNSSRQRTQYYEEQFQYKDNANSSVRERVQKDSPVIAELRTNVIIKDEFTLVTDLSYHLAARYTRPDSAVMVKVDHSACLALGGTFDPCYMLTITTVPSQMGPTMNKRNAALIQSFMADILSVSPERGILKFCPIPEENFAIHGTTMLGEIERQEKQQTNDTSSVARRVISSGKKTIPTFKKSMQKLDTEPPAPGPTTTTEPQLKTTELIIPPRPTRDPSEIDPPTPPTATLTPDGLFELPAFDLEKPRPSTSHSITASTNSNGLRMNGISNAAMEPRNRRPRTFSGIPSNISEPPNQATTLNISATPASPVLLIPAPPPKKSRPHAFLNTDPSKISPTLAPRPSTAHGRSSTSAAVEDKPRPRDSYIDGLMGTPTSPQQGGGGGGGKEKDETTANTAKRRSTITATALAAVPPPPPVPVEAQSARSLRVGKRKSFMAVFRKSTVL